MKVVKVTYHYEDGSAKEFVKEKDAWNEMWNIDWVDEAKPTREERMKERREVFERLRTVDVSIFPLELFKNEEE